MAQDGKILSIERFSLPDNAIELIRQQYPQQAGQIINARYSKIIYLSDGLRVTAYMVEPDETGTFPCIIANRGGNREFGQWNPARIGLLLGRMASWGYVVIATQYRGVDGGEGTEEFGGNELNDVLNLIPVLGEIPAADTTRIGIEGGSRGGMMTYLALKRTCRFKAAAVVAGVTNTLANIADRPEMETHVFSELVPDYQNNKETEMKKRSAVFWADEICRETPLLIMHGSADWRVRPTESLQLVDSLYVYRHPVRFILFEGADHDISEFRDEMLAEMRRHFDYYLRDENSLPDMEPHGR